MSAEMITVDTKPYRIWHHYDERAGPGAWTGSGRRLHAVCGQSEYITVTAVPDRVECFKCLDAMRKAGVITEEDE